MDTLTTTENMLESTEYAARVQPRLTLEVLGRFGPLPAERIPRAWPLGAAHLAAILHDLAGAGAIAFGWDPVCPGRRQVRITPAGAKLLRTDPDGEPLRPA